MANVKFLKGGLMVFSSSIFIFLFLPLCLLFYFLSPKNVKNYTLLVFSIIFYLFGGPKYLLLLLLVVLIDYFGAILIEKTSKRKLFFIITISLNIGILVFFKYTGFFLNNINSLFGASIKVPKIVLPIGISFYTFQAMGYVIDVYRKKVKLQKNFLMLLLYVSLFPQLVAGPIVRYETIEKELKSRKTTFEDLCYGIRRFILGFAKKMIIANQMGALADAIFNSSSLSFSIAFLGGLAYMFQIYFDFSAYSDMAIGMGRMFGFKFLENFNFPYIAKSITEFWRRWHISLSSWFRDYVYIPLGGNRKGKKRQIINMFIVWTLTGFWHGAEWNFIFWGIYYFIFLVLEKYVFKNIIKKMPSFIGHIYTLIIVYIGWIIFRCDNLSSLVLYFKSLFTFNITNVSLNELSVYIETYWVYFILAFVFQTPIYYKLIDKIDKMKKSRLKIVLNIIHYSVLLIIFIIAVMFLAYSSYNPFIYFRF